MFKHVADELIRVPNPFHLSATMSCCTNTCLLTQLFHLLVISRMHQFPPLSLHRRAQELPAPQTGIVPLYPFLQSIASNTTRPSRVPILIHQPLARY